MNLRKITDSALARDSFWAVVGNGLGNAFLLLAGIFIARFLGKDLYGEYGVVKTTMMYSATFATFGLGITSTKFLSEYLQQKKQYALSIMRDSLRVTFVFSVCIAVLILLVSPYLSNYLKHPSLALAFRMLSGIIVFKALVTTQQGILAGLHAFRAAGINNILAGVSMLVLSVPLTYWFGLRGALGALMASQVIACILNHFSIRRCRAALVEEQQTDHSFVRELVSFSFPIALQESSFTICSWLGIMLLTRYATVGDVGIFTASLQWNVIIMMIPTLLSNVVLAHLSGTTHHSETHKATMRRMLLVNVVCAVLPFVVIYPLSGYISQLYGSEFDTMTSVLRILLLDALLFSITTVFKSEYIAQGHNWLLFAVRAVKDVLLVVMAYFLLTGSLSLPGAVCYATAYIASSVLYLLLIVGIYFASGMHRTQHA
ncbi:MAG: oligosaccharide flippase family protein [Paludibacteraceae bacterium]